MRRQEIFKTIKQQYFVLVNACVRNGQSDWPQNNVLFRVCSLKLSDVLDAVSVFIWNKHEDEEEAVEILFLGRLYFVEGNDTSIFCVPSHESSPFCSMYIVHPRGLYRHPVVWVQFVEGSIGKLMYLSSVIT